MTEHIMDINTTKWRHRLVIGVATEGWIRYEWAVARWGQLIPINWQATGFDVNYTALGFNIDDAYNLMTKQCIDMDAEWLLIVEDDVILPPDAFIRFNEYMMKNEIPIVSGLYFTKSHPSEPLIFRGRGNGCFYKWKAKEKVWCDGLPMGCLLINVSILKAIWDQSPEYVVASGDKTRKVFLTPRKVEFQEFSFHFKAFHGTQDLFFFDKLLDNNRQILKDAGWGKIARKKYPFLCDTNIFCRHIDRGSGRQYPIGGLELYESRPNR